MKSLESLSRTGLRIVSVGLILASCSDSSPYISIDSESEQMSTAVEMVALEDSKPVALDPRVECDFGLLEGNLEVQRILADEDDYKAVIVADINTGEVPEFGLVDCFEDEDGIRIVRGNDGW